MKNLISQSLLSVICTVSLFAGGGGDILRSSFNAENLEYQVNKEKTIYWDTYGYIGYDRDKIYIYSEGEKADKADATSENQLLYSRAIAPYWDVQTGIDYDKAGIGSKIWGVVALSGLAPYFFQTRFALLIGGAEDFGLRIDMDYEALITQKLILTPKFTLDSYTKDNPSLGLGSGISNMTLGARLRYEIKRKFAPYIGVEWNKNFGKTNEYAPLDDTYMTVGVRLWF